ncbi:accessory Sec system protein Asp2 [Rahnella ecdela]|uniref:Alpha/beta hydrolase n=1 Tax=Rahnella ecdela TaxID=2816250 RepID=A0ABS6LJA3_9GAMM|nr:accessory Sec system protein Asp2 [Rahnella ecdela]MBU9847015.1 alpha/beta hydrolase [Rahnella ecdela]
MKELKTTIDGVDITYKIKQRKYDNKHLIIVFSGFGATNMFTYDFLTALNDCPATVIWIKDDFNECCSYYLCKDLDFSISHSVNSFIEEKLLELDLNKNNCTLAGFSKGGSTALYYGLKFNYKNIICSVPQLRIGTFINNDWPQVAKHMLGDITKEKLQELDSLIPDLLSTCDDVDKNIYLLTSKIDKQYPEQVKPYLLEFIRYNNFNLFYAESLLIREHNQITPYHVPLLLGIFYSLSQGATPSYGYVELAGDGKVGNNDDAHDPITLLKQFDIREKLIFPEGIAVIKGIPCGEYSDISTKLVFKNTDMSFSFPLAKANRPMLSRQLYERGYVNYDKGWFCTLKFKGLDVSSIEAGSYEVHIDIISGGLTKSKELEADNGLLNKVICDNDFYKVKTEGNKITFTKK